MNANRLHPIDIQTVGAELAIKWNDGHESYFPLEPLRRACPCAACGGEADVMGRVFRPKTQYDSRSFTLRSFAVIGGYALKPVWGDGHNTGLFSFAYLRRLEAENLKP